MQPFSHSVTRLHFMVATNRADVLTVRASRPGTPVDARPCNGAQNEQFQWNSDNTIYALGAPRCLDMFGGVIAAGTQRLTRRLCTGHDNQHWPGTIMASIKPLVSDTLCLDAGSGAQLALQLILRRPSRNILIG